MAGECSRDAVRHSSLPRSQVIHPPEETTYLDIRSGGGRGERRHKKTLLATIRMRVNNWLVSQHNTTVMNYLKVALKQYTNHTSV